MGSEHGGDRSHYTGPSEVSEHHGNHAGQALAAGAAGAGLASMFRRRTSSRHPSHAYEDSRTSISDEKYSDESSRHHGGGGGGGFGKKLLEIGALAGAGLMAKKFWDRRKKREDDAESGRYRPAHSRSTSHTDESLSRMEDGRPEPTHHTPLNRPPSRAPSRSQSPGSSYYYNSTYLTEPPKRNASHGIRDAVLGAGAFAAVKRLFSRGNKKDDEEKRRLEDIKRREDEDEALQRANSRRRPQAGESFYPRRRASSYSETDLTETDLSRPPPRHTSHGESLLTAEPPLASGAVHSAVSDMPPMPPSHQQFSGDLRPEAPPSRHSLAHDGAEFASGAAAGAALDAASRRNRSSSRRRGDDVASPPVSVKVKMHNDGRHVTLRRLTEEEAAASREARRRERRSSRRRNSSAGSLSGNEDAGYDRWRRVEELERRQDEQMRREQAAAAQLAPPQASMAPSGSMPASSWGAPASQVSQMPPAPPIPAPSTIPYGAGSVTSPTYTGTEMSGSYANNRRRRRAERARTRQERQQQHGVEFT